MGFEFFGEKSQILFDRAHQIGYKI